VNTSAAVAVVAASARTTGRAGCRRFWSGRSRCSGLSRTPRSSA